MTTENQPRTENPPRDARHPTGLAHNRSVLNRPFDPPTVIAAADWSVSPRKRQLAMAVLASTAAETLPDRAATGPRYLITRLGPVPAGAADPDRRPGEPDHGLWRLLSEAAAPGQAMIGFDFPIGLPRAYARAAGVASFRAFLAHLGAPPWDEFGTIARTPAEIGLHRPFYPATPGGTSRRQLHDGLGLTAAQIRRRCDGRDAETLFWTLGGKQVGKAALHGWRLLAAGLGTASAPGPGTARTPGLALWPFDGPLTDLLDGGGRVVVAETYPREFYPHLAPGGPGRRWSKRRQADRLDRVPALLAWADSLGVRWDDAVLGRVRTGLSPHGHGEDEFDAVVGLLGMISVLRGATPSGEPPDDPAVATVEGWILGRAPG